jgi:hypothetical protein
MTEGTSRLKSRRWQISLCLLLFCCGITGIVLPFFIGSSPEIKEFVPPLIRQDEAAAVAQLRALGGAVTKVDENGWVTGTDVPAISWTDR